MTADKRCAWCHLKEEDWAYTPCRPGERHEAEKPAPLSSKPMNTSTDLVIPETNHCQEFRASVCGDKSDLVYMAQGVRDICIDASTVVALRDWLNRAFPAETKAPLNRRAVAGIDSFEDRRKTLAALDALEAMSDAWAESVRLEDMCASILHRPDFNARLEGMHALVVQAHMEGLYTGRTSHDDAESPSKTEARTNQGDSDCVMPDDKCEHGIPRRFCTAVHGSES